MHKRLSTAVTGSAQPCAGADGLAGRVQHGHSQQLWRATDRLQQHLRRGLRRPRAPWYTFRHTRPVWRLRRHHRRKRRHHQHHQPCLLHEELGTYELSEVSQGFFYFFKIVFQKTPATNILNTITYMCVCAYMCTRMLARAYVCVNKTGPKTKPWGIPNSS